jgi:hypothetical protein
MLEKIYADMEEKSEIHVNAGKNLRGYGEKYLYPRKTKKLPYFSKKYAPIHKTRKYEISMNFSKYL